MADLNLIDSPATRRRPCWRRAGPARFVT